MMIIIPLLITDGVNPKKVIKHSVSSIVSKKRTRYAFAAPNADNTAISIVIISVKCIPDTAVR